MATQSIVSGPSFPPEKETQAIQSLEKLLSTAYLQAKLVGLDGEEIVLPDSVYQILRQVIHLMASGQAVSLVPLDHELTTQEAANLLNVSRPFLIKLLESEEIPYTKVGSHRRIRFEDLMEYKKQRDQKRHHSLRNLIQFSQDEGFYDA